MTEIVRSEVEKCDNFQGFQWLYARSGGHGGIGSHLAIKLRDHFPTKSQVTFSVFPADSDNADATLREQMYSLCAMESERESSDLCFVLNNNAMQQIAKNTFGLQQPAYSDLNWIAAMSMYIDITHLHSIHFLYVFLLNDIDDITCCLSHIACDCAMAFPLRFECEYGENEDEFGAIPSLAIYDLFHCANAVTTTII